MLLHLILLCLLVNNKLNAVQSYELYGSRVITKTTGSPGTMLFRATDQAVFELYRNDTNDVMTISKNDECVLQNERIGSPCSKKEGVAKITLSDASKYLKLVIYDKDNVYTVFFAENCTFPEPQFRGLVASKSGPLYRFMKNQDNATIEFALMNGKYYDNFYLYRGSVEYCTWHGDAVSKNPYNACGNIYYDKKKKVRVARILLKRIKNVDFETVSLETVYVKDIVAITIDWENEVKETYIFYLLGEAPEALFC